MVDGIKQYGIEDNKISMIPNMSKINEFWPREKNLDLLKKLDLNVDSFKIIHFGAMGIANGLEFIVKAAEIIQKQGLTEIEFIFIGGGKVENELKETALKRNISNLKFLGSFSMELTSEIVNFCDISLVSFSNIPILKTNSPNKFFDSLSAGKPIIVNSDGWTKDIVVNQNCGFYCNYEKPEELAIHLRELITDKEKLSQMGANSRRLAESVYDKGILTRKKRERGGTWQLLIQF